MPDNQKGVIIMRNITLNLNGFRIGTKTKRSGKKQGTGIVKAYTDCCNARRGQKYYCKECGEEQPYHPERYGVELGEETLYFSKEEYNQLQMEKQGELKIETFVEADKLKELIERKKREYKVMPDKEGKGKKKYSILLKALKEENKIGIGQLVTKARREKLFAVIPKDNMLVLISLYYKNELTPSERLKAEYELPEPKQDQVKMVKQLIQKREKDTGVKELNEYTDEYKNILEEAIERKETGEKIPIVEKDTQEEEDVTGELERALATA